jgi:uncharacterized membrane protein
MEKSRIAALIDGIFAVAMTLLVLDLKLREGVKLSDDAQVWRQLVELRSSFSTYILSFVVLGAFWIGHHSLFHFVRRVNRGLLWLNLLFLLFVTLVPFSANLLSNYSSLHVPVAVFGGNLLLLTLVSLLQLSYLVHHPELAHDQLTPAWIANHRLRAGIPGVVAAASIAISFLNPSLALTAYWLILVFHFLQGRHHQPPAVSD